MSRELPVAVIGSGPVGLAAAAHLVLRNIPVRLFEAGGTIAPNLLQWGHVRLFSVWEQCIDEAATVLLRKNGWQGPPKSGGLPTGSELVEHYLRPLAATPELRQIIETTARVVRITRQGLDRVATRDRGNRPFVLTIRDGEGQTREVHARAVIDASGTWQTPNPIGSDGWPVPGEEDNTKLIHYGIPDISGADRKLYAGKHTLVLGTGHSAANALLDLALLAERAPGTALTWAIRGNSLTKVFGGGAADQLPARGALGNRLHGLVEEGRLSLEMSFSAQRVVRRSEGLVVEGNDPGGTRSLGPFDRIVVATGQRPDLSFARELQLDLHPIVQSARDLGPLIDPNLHSCGTVPPHGWRVLSHPEPDYFIAGIKSYGRAPTFLLLTGYEQVRSIAAHLAGDHAAADDVRLVLPETGVCNATLDQVAPGGLCCDGAAADAETPCCERPTDQRSSPCCGKPVTVLRTRELQPACC